MCVCVCGGPLLGLRLGCVTTARDRRMKSGQVFRVYRAAVSHTTRTGKVTSDFTPTEAHESPSAFTGTETQSYPDTHTSETTLGLYSESFICLIFSVDPVPLLKTSLISSCLVSALHVSFCFFTSNFLIFFQTLFRLLLFNLISHFQLFPLIKSYFSLSHFF